MDLSLIFTIPNKPGLYKMVSQAKNSAIVESLADGKRMPMFNLNQVSSLAEIAIYAENKEVELSEIFRRLHKKENGAATLHHKEDFGKIKQLFEEILPDYDRERVYESNIRKVIQWYNLLIEKGLVDQELSEREQSAIEKDSSQDKENAQSGEAVDGAANTSSADTADTVAKGTKSSTVKSSTTAAKTAKTAEKAAAKSTAKTAVKANSKTASTGRVTAVPRKTK